MIIEGIYPESMMKSNDSISVRGDNCNLTWDKGVVLKKSWSDGWKVMLSCPTSKLIQIKLLLNDKVWMLGANYWFTIYSRANITVYPSF